jgi:CheY-like chemotaxis protein
VDGVVTPQPDPLPPRPFRGILVLVVDDDPFVLDATRQMLERLGALVRTAHNGEAGLRAAVIHRPHLILIDLDMPAMDGFELARRLRWYAQLGRARLVALTSPHHPAAMPGWSVEFDGRINKPVTEEALAALARQIPGGRASPGAE